MSWVRDELDCCSASRGCVASGHPLSGCIYRFTRAYVNVNRYVTGIIPGIRRAGGMAWPVSQWCNDNITFVSIPLDHAFFFTMRLCLDAWLFPYRAFAALLYVNASRSGSVAEFTFNDINVMHSCNRIHFNNVINHNIIIIIHAARTWKWRGLEW